MEPEGTGLHRKRHFRVLPLLLLIVAVAIFALSSPYFRMKTFGVSSSEPIVPKAIQLSHGGAVPSAAPQQPMFQESSARMEVASFAANDSMAGGYYPQPSYGGTPTITDTREFLKTTYSAHMRTRTVQELTRRAETTVRGFDGRVDSISSSEKNGFLNFVVPASKFEKFREEIESFVPPKFLKVDVQSYNKLSQKQNIEASQEQVETNLEELQAKRSKVVSEHQSAVSSYNNQIDDVQTEISAIRSLPPTDDYVEWNRRLNREGELTSLLTTLRSRLSNENSNYKYTLDSVDQQIKYANQNLEGVKKQDQNLIDDIATVNGTITFSWISLWEIAELYIPISGNTIATILMLAAIAAYMWGAVRIL